MPKSPRLQTDAQKGIALLKFLRDEKSHGHVVMLRDDSGNNWYIDIENAVCLEK